MPMHSLYSAAPHHFHLVAYPDFHIKRFNEGISKMKPKLTRKCSAESYLKLLHVARCIDSSFLIDTGSVLSPTSEARASNFMEMPVRPDSCLQDLLGKAEVIYQKLCEARLEDVREVLESTRDEILLSDLRSIVERFDDDSDWMKALLIFQWAREQRIFQPAETETEEDIGCALQDEEVKAIVIEFLRSLGLSMGFSTRVTKKSRKFITHLQSIVLNRYRARFSEGEKLSTLEIQEVLVPYLEALAMKHENELINVLVYFPDPPPMRVAKMPDKKYLSSSVKHFNVTSLSIAKRDAGGNCGLTFNGNFRPSVSYALSLGLSLAEVQSIANKYPSFLFYSPEKKIKPTVSYFLALGVTKAVVIKIFLKRPQVFGCNLEEKLKPTMLYLESIGVDKSQWPGMLERYPIIFTFGKDQIQKIVNFLHSVGFSATDVRRALSRFPHLVSYSIEQKFEPILVFLKSIIGGKTEVEALLRSFPQTLGYSIDGNMKPTLRFLIEIGYNESEVVSIIKSYPEILGLAITTDTRPKWDYYVKVGWQKSDLVTFPQYFGYSLELTIKPRFEKILKLKHGSCWTLKRILTSSDKEFERLIRLEMARH